MPLCELTVSVLTSANSDGLTLMKRHTLTALLVRKCCSAVGVCSYMCECHSVRPPLRAATYPEPAVMCVTQVGVIAFGTSVPCHLCATNVTELRPNPDILYSAPWLIWLE